MVSGPELIVIDGRSGAGKSEFSQKLATDSGFPIVSLDWLYPGWDGLDAGQAMMVDAIITHWGKKQSFILPRWDWHSMMFRDVVSVDVTRGLIIEGCGSLSTQSAEVATRSIWLEADDQERQARALARDGETYRPHWKRWALQEERFLTLHRSPDLADEIIRT